MWKMWVQGLGDTAFLVSILDSLLGSHCLLEKLGGVEWRLPWHPVRPQRGEGGERGTSDEAP